MRKLICVLLGSVAAVLATAQTENIQKVVDGVNDKLDKVAETVAPFKMGVQAGFDVSRFSHSGFTSMAGFNVGVTTLFDASDILRDSYVRASLLFQRKGATYEESGWKDMRFHVGYLEIPLRYGYSYLLKDNWTLLAETGPYFAWGLGGKVHDFYDYSQWKQDDVKFFKKLDARRFDFGWGLHAGLLLYQKHQVLAGWDWGFVNLTDGLLQNRNFAVSYAYYFR